MKFFFKSRITLNDFFKNPQRCYIRCATLEQAEQAMKWFNAAGRKWRDGDRYGRETLPFVGWGAVIPTDPEDGLFLDNKGGYTRSYSIATTLGARISEFDDIDWADLILKCKGEEK